MAQKGFEIGQCTLQRSGRSGEAIGGQAVRAAQFQLSCGLIEEIGPGSVAFDGFDTRPQNCFESRRQLLFFLTVGNYRHAGGEFGFALP